MTEWNGDVRSSWEPRIWTPLASKRSGKKRGPARRRSFKYINRRRLAGYPGIAGKAFPTREMSEMVHAAIIIREAVAEAQRRFHEIHRHSFARMGPSLADPPQFIIRLERAVFFAESGLSSVVRSPST